MRKKYAPLALLTIALLLLASSCALAANLKAAPPAKAFLRYRERAADAATRAASGGAEYKRGYFPSPVDLSHLAEPDMRPQARGTRGALPAKYDPRGSAWLSSARSQPYDNCWSYAALGAMETAYQKAKGAAVDLSEMHLTWYAYKSVPGFTMDEDDPRAEGGTDNIAVATLARWIGAVAEADLPERAQPTGTYENYENRLHLQDAFMMGLELDEATIMTFPRDTLKTLVHEHGGLSVGFFYDDAYYNEETSAYFYNGREGGNHAVLLVGWDDAYAKENFLESARPSRDGAWLIRNSWGTEWGDDGYFWLSYEDAALSGGTAYLSTESVEPYDELYEHDELGWCASASGAGGDTAWFANVFQATDATQMVEAVSFYTTSNNAEYDIYVYTRLTDLNDPTSGILATAASGKEPYAGYHTVAFENRGEVSANSRFSVVVKMRTPGYDQPIAVEAPIDGYSDRATANEGESFFSADGSTWEFATLEDDGGDVPVNVCLKAFVTFGNGGPGDEIMPQVSDNPSDWTIDSREQADGSVHATIRTRWYGSTEVENLSVATRDLGEVACSLVRNVLDPSTYDLVIVAKAASQSALDEAMIASVSYEGFFGPGSYFTYNLTPPLRVGNIGTPGASGGEGWGGDGGGGCATGSFLLCGAAVVIVRSARRKRN